MMSVEPSNWVSHFLALIGIVLVSLPTFWLVKLARKFETHRAIAVSDVTVARLFEKTHVRELSGSELEQLVDQFNSAIFIQKREDATTTANHKGIEIELTSGEQILIIQRETDFDIIRRRPDKKQVAYWARQTDLQILLQKSTA